jgi:hypothetical protein
VLERKHQDALKRQITMRVTVRIAHIDEIDQLGIEEYDRDFGLFDDFAVSFWKFAHRFNQGRLFSLTVDQAECMKYREIYARVKALCVDVPGKHDGDTKVFDSVEELGLWLAERS